MTTSIRQKMLLWVLSSVVIVWAISLTASYRRAEREINDWQVSKLAEVADMLLLLSSSDLANLSRSYLDGRFERPTTAESASMTHTPISADKAPRELLFVVLDAGGDPIATSARLQPSMQCHKVGQPADGRAASAQSWRAVAVDSPSGRTACVFSLANTQSDLRSGIAYRIVFPLLIALPALALLIWVAIGRSLAPVRDLSRRLERRDDTDLNPIAGGSIPSELRPLTDALNSLLSRLRQSFDRERAFIANAAHELRTPLSAIKVQAQVAQGETCSARRDQAIRRVLEGVDRSARLTEQLLALARLEDQQSACATATDLRQIVIAAVERCTPAAAAKLIRIESDIDTPDERDVLINAEPAFCSILVDNLLDNAIKYGRSGGDVALVLRIDQDMISLICRDNGPGVAPSDMPNLTRRFYRGIDTIATGSGLGLAIVRSVAEKAGGTLAFGTGLNGTGLGVQVRLPRVQAPALESFRSIT